MDGMKGSRQSFDFGGYLVRVRRPERTRFTDGLLGRVAKAESKEQGMHSPASTAAITPLRCVLASGFATAQLHHHPGHDHQRPSAVGIWSGMAQSAMVPA
jgi:hypothetical protein